MTKLEIDWGTLGATKFGINPGAPVGIGISGFSVVGSDGGKGENSVVTNSGWSEIVTGINTGGGRTWALGMKFTMKEEVRNVIA